MKSLKLFSVLFLNILFVFSGYAQVTNIKDVVEVISGPEYLGEPVASEGTSLIKDRSGKINFVYRKGDWDHGGFSTMVYYMQSEDEGRTWSKEMELVNTPGKVAQSFATISPISGEIMVFYINRGQGIFCARSKNNWTDWSLQKMTTSDNAPINTIGYGNSLWIDHNGSKRVICGFHVSNMTGSGTFYSDDDGRTWKSSERINVPNTIPNIWKTGAVEPTIAQLSNGNLLMILRNSNFNLWQSVSTNKGASWSQPVKTDLYCGDNSWVTLKNLKNGKLLLIWNNSKALRPEVTNDQWNFTGREVLHMALSEDDGESWNGFRELMLDRLRDSLFVNHPGDKGLNESKVVETAQGNILVACGQAAGHRSFVLVNPKWITKKERADSFNLGTSQWSRQKIIKRPPIYKRYYHYNYDRKPGAVLVEHPENPKKQVLHLRREPDTTVYSQRDGAVWNFTAGRSGQFETRIRLNEGFKGASIALNDRWFQPIDNQGIETAMFVLEIPSTGKIGSDTVLMKDTWYDLKFVWKDTHNPKTAACQIYVNGQWSSIFLPLKNASVFGISYARFRSDSRTSDINGMFIEQVSAKAK